MKPRSSHSTQSIRSVFRPVQPLQHILTHVSEKFPKGYDLNPGTDQGPWARTRDDACETPRSAFAVPMDQPRQRSRNLSLAASGATGEKRNRGVLRIDDDRHTFTTYDQRKACLRTLH